MAIVPNKAGTTPTDVPFDSANRNVGAEPNGTTVPMYAGEIVLDTANNCWWKATTLSNTSWVALTPPA